MGIAVSGCVLHVGARNRHGYGHKRHEGKIELAHRVAYCLAMDVPIASIAGKVVLHTCDTPSCVNWQHLVLGTQADNVADMEAKGRGRHPSGEQHGKAALTMEQAREIRTLYVRGSKETGTYALARKYGVGDRAIGRIVNGQSYKEV